MTIGTMNANHNTVRSWWNSLTARQRLNAAVDAGLLESPAIHVGSDWTVAWDELLPISQQQPLLAFYFRTIGSPTSKAV
jgi:hypothetical protein